jgi:hypothetical protein
MSEVSKRERERRKMLDRIRKGQEEIRQLFRDVAYWNEHVRTPFEDRINPDPDGQLTRIAEACDRTLAAEAKPRGVSSS